MRILLLALFITVLALSCNAQDASVTPEFKLPRSIIKLSPLQLFSNTLELGIESFNPSFSKSFQVTAGLRSGASAYHSGNGVSVELAYRKYVAPMKFQTRKNRGFYQGIYYSLFVNGSYFKGEGYPSYFYNNPPTGENNNVTASSISSGFTIGLQKTLWKVIILDVYIGGGIRFSEVKRNDIGYPGSNGLTEPGHEGIYPKIGVKIGVGL